jgi:DNA repair exonuclease SbcCD ATPase subunit
MAKRTKTAARAGKVKQPAQKPEWKAIETKREIEEDVGSDDGSFMDDDTEDFLPSGWTGTVKGKMESLTAQGPRTHVAVPDPKSTTSQSTSKITNTQAITTSLQRTTLESATAKSDVLPSIAEKPKEGPPTQTPGISEPTKIAKVTISRLEVSATLLQKPVTQIEELEQQIDSLKQQLKTTKYHATTRRTELEARVKRQDKEIKNLRIEIADKNGLRSQQYLALKTERQEIEAQRMKATDDYRKLMNVHADLENSKVDLIKKWVSANFDLSSAQKEVEKLREEGQGQDLKVKQLQRQVNEGLEEKRRLDNRIAIAEHTRETSQRAYNSVFSELQNVRSQLTNASNARRNNQRSRHAYDHLQNKYDNLRDDYDDAKREIRDLKRDIKDLKGDKRSLQRDLDDAEDDVSK